LHSKIEIKEFGWYVFDHLFRQYNQDKRQFEKESLVKTMLSSYLRYRNSNLHHLHKTLIKSSKTILTTTITKITRPLHSR